MSAYMRTELAGKIRNLPDFKETALLPVFEAVVNSIHAIEEADRVADGYVEVRVHRIVQQSMIGDDHELPKIGGFEIIDNGIGFTDANYESFGTSDSSYKLNKGCKGVGRFLWLKAFTDAEIDSVYMDDGGNAFHRVFTFDPFRGMVDKQHIETDSQDCKTIVKLNGFKPDYRNCQSAYRTTEKIAQRILEHCLAYYISGKAPHIVVADDSESKRIDLNRMFEAISKGMVSEEFPVSDQTFTIHHLRLFDTYADMHEMTYCANGRGVKSCSLQRALGTKTQFDDSGKKFFYAAYITSPYLDTMVDTYHQTFSIPEKNSGLLSESASMEEIETTAIQHTRSHLASVLESIAHKKQEMIDEYVDENPGLRAVAKYCPDVLSEVELNSSRDRICEVLYAHKGRAELDIKKRSERLLKTQASSVDEINNEYQDLVARLDDFQKDELAAYVLRRKLIIDLLDKKLELNREGKFPNEDIIHDIVFPRKTDSCGIDFEDHNLWLIDDTLAFHRFACSDKPMKDFSTSESEDRPDIVVFSEIDEDRVARAVSLFEFKKPQRKQFDEDPTKQLYRYVRGMRNDKKFRLNNGRDITVTDETRFYCYAICDITEPIAEFADNNNYAKLQGELGYYLYNRNRGLVNRCVNVGFRRRPFSWLLPALRPLL